MASLPDIGLGQANLLNLGLVDLIDIAARHGFRKISARPRSVIEAIEQGHNEASLRRRLRDAGVQVTMIDGLARDLPGVPSTDTFDAALRSRLHFDMLNPVDAETCFRAASALEAPLLNVVAYKGEVVPVEQMAEAISVLCRRATPHGVRLALEFFPVSGIPNIVFGGAVVAACGEPNCGLTLDTFHLDRSDGTVADVHAQRPGSILTVQISDRVRSASATYVPLQGRLMPGEGEIPLHEVVHAALENSPETVVEIEVLNGELQALAPDEAVSRMTAAFAAWRASYEARYDQ